MLIHRKYICKKNILRTLTCGSRSKPGSVRGRGNGAWSKENWKEASCDKSAENCADTHPHRAVLEKKRAWRHRFTVTRWLWRTTASPPFSLARLESLLCYFRLKGAQQGHRRGRCQHNVAVEARLRRVSGFEMKWKWWKGGMLVDSNFQQALWRRSRNSSRYGSF